MKRFVLTAFVTIGVALSIPVATAQQSVRIAPTQTPQFAIAPVSSPSAEGSRVLKAGPGNLYQLIVSTGGTAGWVMLFNSTTVPADGVVAPAGCWKIAANTTLALSWLPGPPHRATTGMTVVFSSTGCFEKTISATAFFTGYVQ